MTPPLRRSFESRTRGNSFKLLHIRPRLDVRKYSFCVRVIGLWSSLPEYVVKSTSVNNFKNNLDKFWEKEEFF